MGSVLVKVAIVALIVAAIGVAIAWSTLVYAESTVSVQCPKEFNFCFGSKRQFQDLIEFNQAMAKELARRESCPQKSDI